MRDDCMNLLKVGLTPTGTVAKPFAVLTYHCILLASLNSTRVHLMRTMAFLNYPHSHCTRPNMVCIYVQSDGLDKFFR